jgi:hypothetical protein
MSQAHRHPQSNLTMKARQDCPLDLCFSSPKYWKKERTEIRSRVEEMMRGIGGINRFERARLVMEVDTLEAYILTWARDQETLNREIS